MVRDRKRKAEIGSFYAETMEQAVAMVLSGLNIRAAADEYGMAQTITIISITTYGITTYRKRLLAIPASRILLQWEHFVHGALNSVAVWLQFLCQVLVGLDSSC
ncbi:hypothetical protein Pmani_002787 [Petrolisthes manimaculis]|uniref:Uncharacterized protein n=1 Tax=Petrolisthes manimaculis TaxID=1843537 RepID=A0AAE1QI51_9EUCA|nr:hypothetical protein Pmani_002787 [Petrolisthes manimaculis]